MNYPINSILLQNIIDYLETKPYIEVVNLINAIKVEVQEHNNKINIPDKEVK
jgi:hypothetical protein